MIRGDEITPTPLPEPIGSTAPVNGEFAAGTLEFTAAPTDGETVTIGAKIYTWRTTLGAPANEVKIEATAEDCIDSLSAAVAAGSGSGTLFSAATTPNADVYPLSTTSTALSVEAIVSGAAGNSIATTNTMANASWGASTLTDGVTATLAPPYLRTAGGFLYIQEAGTWKKTALSAL